MKALKSKNVASSVTVSLHLREYVRVPFMERTMREASDVRRVAAIAGVSAIAIVSVYPFFAATAQKVPPAHATEPQRAQGL
jgi:hypothetical protein